ncbi:uncharacterized protein P174DRAFT_417583 [Aspergillus novofumigatus IBT 16806]|uniref:Fumarylacetoacetate hydrolase n=1 Tax=Aspergillus novofumigatus (strain IBT 16806) TaxID=1392255 RepID=A0A2I1CFZ9_ASPN1|nr:uncharacterized protein P174DRAFT_417583 [Aspergillus novofumigatus IBT 16806]PKX96559.1 hypothetical protein P174DRAFT_417583 [Aspergillus novofumigatus IBT 16806]
MTQYGHNINPNEVHPDFARLSHHFSINNEADQHIFGLVVLNNWSVEQPATSKVRNVAPRPAPTVKPLEPPSSPGSYPRVSLPRHLKDIVDFTYAISVRASRQHAGDLRTGDILGTGTDASSGVGFGGCVSDLKPAKAVQ